jgi:hypothetical protein
MTKEYNNNNPLISGMAVDILTGKPLEMVQTQTDVEEQAREKMYLQNKLDFLDISKTLSGQKLLELVYSHLARRIDYLVANDQQATAFVTLLHDMGAKEFQAAEASKKYFERYVKKE